MPSFVAAGAVDAAGGGAAWLQATATINAQSVNTTRLMEPPDAPRASAARNAARQYCPSKAKPNCSGGASLVMEWAFYDAFAADAIPACCRSDVPDRDRG